MEQSFQVGDVLGPLEKPPVTRVQLVKYAGASFDFNPIHTVDEFAAEQGLGGVIAHGMLSMGFLGQMLTDVTGDNALLRTFRVRFTNMVRPGDSVTCQGVVTDVSETEEGRLVNCTIEAKIQDGTQVLTGDASFVAARP